jgi:hypothetical protein
VIIAIISDQHDRRFRPNQRHQSIRHIDISQNAACWLLKPSVLTLLSKDRFYRDTCVLMGKKAVILL